MTGDTIAALAFVAATAAPIIVQVGLALGAPWGKLTLGGKWPGRLPQNIRVAALAQAAILAALSVIVWDHAGLVTLGLPSWLIWIVVIVSCLTALLNNITPSQIERRFWGGPTIIMAIAALYLAAG